MREYLFELRKKANKTQKEITKILFEKYSVNLSYSQIERGTKWSTISEKRAQILADALESTAEYILECDAKYGGYEGRDFRSGRRNPFQVKHGRRTEYDEPLTKEEKEIAEKYTPYAEKMINIFRFKEYRSILEKGIMTYEDFYDIGMIAFLRSIKEITVKKTEKSSFFETLEEPDYFYRFSFSRAIKDAYYHYVRDELVSIRKDYHNAYSMDETVSLNDGDGSDKYNLVPNNDIPIPVVAESTWSLSNLYSYLNDEQISACKFLINGWTSKEIMAGGYASKLDIGIIQFYLNQIKTYGKILWDLEEYKHVEKNVNFDFRANKWVVKFKYKGHDYSLGTYTDLNIALDLKNIACYHINKGDFRSWFSAHTISNIRFGQEKTEFIYPLENYEEVGFNIVGNTQKRLDCKSHPFRTATKENPIGIRKCGKNSYYVTLQQYDIGAYQGFDKAFEIRKLAESHMLAGDIDEWYTNLKLEKEKEKITYTRIETRKSAHGISYVVVRGFKQKYTYLGVYSNKDEANAVRLLADSHIDTGDFDEWAEKFRSDRKANIKQKSSRCVPAFAFTASYALCKYICGIYNLLCYDTSGSEHQIGETADVEEAYKTMDLANEHIEAGDFDVWFADYKNIKTEE